MTFARSLATFIAGTAACLSMSAAHAQSRPEAEDICRAAIRERGFEDYRYESIAGEQQNGDWSFTGELSGRNERVTFRCALDHRQVRTLDMNRVKRDERPGDDRNVTCESENRKRNRCVMDTRGGVRLAQQISQTDCRQGRNWGYDQRSVWVDDGCSARFTSGRSDPEPRVPQRLFPICEREVARDRDRRPDEAQALRGRVAGQRFEIDVRLRGDEYVCSVDNDGRVRGIRRK